MNEKIIKTETEWRKILTPEQYRIMRERGTEAPGTCQFNENKGPGVYNCAACDLPLFKSATKFESGTGWPSFHEPYNENHLAFFQDHDLRMARTEVRCARCDSHLGHVFDDGPLPIGRRFCINGLALKFVPKE